MPVPATALSDLTVTGDLTCPDSDGPRPVQVASRPLLALEWHQPPGRPRLLHGGVGNRDSPRPRRGRPRPLRRHWRPEAATGSACRGQRGRLARAEVQFEFTGGNPSADAGPATQAGRAHAVCTPPAGRRPGVRLGSGRVLVPCYWARAAARPANCHWTSESAPAEPVTVTRREPPARRLPVPGPLAVSLPVTVLARYDISSRHRRGAVTRTLSESTVYGHRNFSNVQEEGPCQWGRLTWPVRVSSGKTTM